MAKQRYINTKFWSDDWIANLDPIEKLLFLYLLSNERTNICGIYELPIKYMSVETGIEKEMVEKILKRFEKNGKVYFKDGWVVIRNFQKHQDSGNEKIKIGIENCMNNAPKWAMDTLSISYIYPPNNSNTNTNTNSKETQAFQDKDRKELIFLFKDVNPNYEIFFSRKNQGDALARMVKKFGREKVENTIRQLPEIINKKYAPKITSPIQLENKLGELIAFYKQEKDKVGTNKAAIII